MCHSHHCVNESVSPSNVCCPVCQSVSLPASPVHCSHVSRCLSVCLSLVPCLYSATSPGKESRVGKSLPVTCTLPVLCHKPRQHSTCCELTFDKVTEVITRSLLLFPVSLCFSGIIDEFMPLFIDFSCVFE